MDRAVWLISDGMQHLRDYDQMSFNAQDASYRRARRAVLAAYRDVPARHDWNFLKREQFINTVPAYSTGFIAYDASGGARERLVTLTDGVFPEWVGFGQLVIGNVAYDIAERVSDTQVVLAETSCPGDDLSSGTTYSVVRAYYPAPDLVAKTATIQEVSPGFRFISFDWSPGYQWWIPAGTPICVRMRRHNQQQQFRFCPAPIVASSYRLRYMAIPRQPTLSGMFAEGTVDVTAGARVVTFTGGTLPLDIAGCVLRLGTDTDAPGGNDSNEDPPFTNQYEIAERISDTQLRLAEDPVADAAAAKFIIDDPIDVDPRIALTWLQREIESNYSAIAKKDDRDEAVQRADYELRRAKEADSQYVPNISAPYCMSPTYNPTVIYSTIESGGGP